jgi:hypothetical protein
MAGGLIGAKNQQKLFLIDCSAELVIKFCRLMTLDTWFGLSNKVALTYEKSRRPFLLK